jgi:hypothetical protein
MKQKRLWKSLTSCCLKGKRTNLCKTDKIGLLTTPQSRCTDKRLTHSDYTESFQCDASAPLENITMHCETAQLLVTVLEFDKKIKLLQRRECLSSVPHSDHLMPTQHCIQWVPAALSLDIMHPV